MSRLSCAGSVTALELIFLKEIFFVVIVLYILYVFVVIFATSILLTSIKYEWHRLVVCGLGWSLKGYRLNPFKRSFIVGFIKAFAAWLLRRTVPLLKVPYVKIEVKISQK